MESNDLKQYQELLEQGLSSLDNDLLFEEILKKSETTLMLTDSTLAAEMKMSRSTVNRWRSGATTPYPLMRRGVYTWLKKRAALMIKKIDSTIKINQPIKQPVSASQAET